MGLIAMSYDGYTTVIIFPYLFLRLSLPRSFSNSTDLCNSYGHASAKNEHLKQLKTLSSSSIITFIKVVCD